MTFQDFNFDTRLAEGLTAMGFTQPTPIQEQSIPLILENKDLIACAQTGTGKTAAYLLPILDKIVRAPEDKRHLNTLILAPTRELATQIDQQVEGLGYFTGVSSISVYGGGDGAAWSQQQKALLEGSDVVIATPGRLIALLQMKAIDFSRLQHLILDEADRMLDMGFYDDIIRIISYLPRKRQTLLFSATMPPKIRTLANTILIKPEQINISISKPAEGIRQEAYLAFDHQKVELIRHIFSGDSYASAVIFASTKEDVRNLAGELRKIGLQVKAFHSDLLQKERDEILREFKNKTLPVLIGTDILSRGIDVEGISLVVNFNVPHEPEDYIHRIGRTARAATTGTAITLVNEKDQRKFASIERLIGREIDKVPLPAELGEGPVYHPPVSVKKKFRKKRPYGKSGNKSGKKPVQNNKPN
ncbi:DEAD/DEAH box helicase [Xanthocytophaga flava]|uniref:DEAD/DEAH box helicase n=1 Tax=Xanthocytophaga flava TaxID=3048013 RepID=UPI0028D77C3E|nr:DEAD/DEAH box helicase [Xanthocytophaga flavus]MDJ1467957.1 DEAD/DEAH box helicase [Xanthocytophaga flavus]